MNTRKWLIVVQVIILPALVTLALFTGLTHAQGLGPNGESQPQGPADVTAAVGDAIPIQGRLTDASGNPLNGNYNMTFRLYDVATGGTARCSYNNPAVAVANGLFAVNMTGCDNADIDGTQLYLGVTVGTDAEMDPRQPIYAVPYARSLRPGARIGGSGAGPGILSMYDENDIMQFQFHAQVSSLYLGGSGEAAEIYVKNQADNNTISLNGGSALLNVGTAGEAGNLTVRNDSNSTSFSVDGSTNKVSQIISGTGLVKAGFYGHCGTGAGAGTRAFNNVNLNAIDVTGTDVGRCTIDFGFDVFDRYFVATSVYSAPRFVSCYTYIDQPSQLFCGNWDAAGAGQNGSIMLLVY